MTTGEQKVRKIRAKLDSCKGFRFLYPRVVFCLNGAAYVVLFVRTALIEKTVSLRVNNEIACRAQIADGSRTMDNE